MTSPARSAANRHSTPRYAGLAFGALLAVSALSACSNSGSSSVIEAEGNGQITDAVTQGIDRNAAQDGQWLPTQSCPVQDKSYDLEVLITNWLPQPITLKAGNLDCYDWSGDKTPPTVLNGQQITPGQTRQFTLRVRGNTDRNWSMSFSAPAGSNNAEFTSDVFRAQNPMNSTLTYIAADKEGLRCGTQKLGVNPGFYAQPQPGKISGSTQSIQFWSNGTNVMGTVACP